MYEVFKCPPSRVWYLLTRKREIRLEIPKSLILPSLKRFWKPWFKTRKKKTTRILSKTIPADLVNMSKLKWKQKTETRKGLGELRKKRLSMRSSEEWKGKGCVRWVRYSDSGRGWDELAGEAEGWVRRVSRMCGSLEIKRVIWVGVAGEEGGTVCGWVCVCMFARLRVVSGTSFVELMFLLLLTGFSPITSISRTLRASRVATLPCPS